MIPITGHTQLTALLGSPVAHSISPLMHSALTIVGGYFVMYFLTTKKLNLN